VCSYPTYEEWKLLTNMYYNHSVYQFLSYLWGMETFVFLIDFTKCNLCSYPTYEEWKRTYVRSKVTQAPLGSYPTYEEWKLTQSSFAISNLRFSFLSYLWGMETFTYVAIVSAVFRSYPTYEEWKQYDIHWTCNF